MQIENNLGEQVRARFACSDHLRLVLNPETLKREIKNSLPYLRKQKKKYDFQAIAATGLSGIIYGTALSTITGWPLLAIRPKGSRCHSCCRVEGISNATRYAIVDDFIDSSATIYRIRKELKLERPHMKPVVILLYNRYQDDEYILRRYVWYHERKRYAVFARGIRKFPPT